MTSPAAVARIPAARRRTGLLDFARNALGNGLFMILGIASSIASARLLGPSARGELAASMAWILLLTALGDMGVSQAVPVLSARDERIRDSVFWTGLILGLALPLCCLLPVALLLQFDSFGIPHRICEFILVLLLTVPMNLGGTYISGSFQGIGRHGAFNSLRVIGNLPYPIVLVGALALRAPYLGAILWIYVLVSAAIFALQLVLAYRWWPYGHRGPSLDTAKSMLRFGARTYLGNIAWVSNGKLGPVFLSATVATATLGLYSVGASYATLEFALGSAIALLAANHVGSCREPADAKRKARRLFKAALGTSLGGAILLIGCAGFLLTFVFGHAYQGSIEMARVLTGVSCVLGLDFVLSATLRALDRPFAPSIAEMVGLAVTLLATLPLIREMGAIGAAWAAGVSATFTFVVLLFQFRCVTQP